MNVGRILAGGLLAGLVMNIGEYILNGVIMMEEWDAAMAELGMEPMTGAMIGVVVVLIFVLGIAFVWLYAAMRPRFGAGPRTAVIAGLFAWLLLSGVPFVWNQLVPIFPSNLMMVGLVWSFFEITISTLVGAWIYQEKVPLM